MQAENFFPPQRTLWISHFWGCLCADPGDVEPFDPPVQLRLGFDAPSEPLLLDIMLAGLTVLAVCDPPHRVTELQALLQAAGVGAEPHDSGGLGFPVGDLHLVARLPDIVKVVCDSSAEPLWELVSYPPADGVPATLEAGFANHWVLRWHSDVRAHLVDLPVSASAALLTSNVPFVASPEDWKKLQASTNLPVQVGRARLNLDGFVEISTPKPQLVEASPISSLFRLDDTHFGVPLPHAAQVTDIPIIDWVGDPPIAESGPRFLPGLPINLSVHASADLRDLTGLLAATRAAAVVWEPGLGRRILVLAAIEALDAWPALVVCDPAQVWAWRRHLTLLGRTSSITGSDGDARILTYNDLAAGVSFDDPAAVVFDEPFDREFSTSAARRAAHRLDHVLDAYRVTVCGRWPDDDVAAQLASMTLLRPVEFRDDVDLVWRYPLRPEHRAAAHVDAYLMRRLADDPGRDRTPFRRNSVVRLHPSAALAEAMATQLTSCEGSERRQVLSEMLELSASGSKTVSGPKFAVVLEKVMAAAAAGRRIAVVSRSLRLLTMVAKSAGFAEPRLTTGAPFPNASVALVHLTEHLGDLRNFDDVVICDLPWSHLTLDRAVGPPGGPGPASVTVLHLDGSVDDRVAMLSALRSEELDGDEQIDDDEVVWLTARH